MCDMIILNHCLASILFRDGVVLGQPCYNACEDFARMTPISLITREEEARTKTVIFMVSTSHRASDSKLPYAGYSRR